VLQLSLASRGKVQARFRIGGFRANMLGSSISPGGGGRSVMRNPARVQFSGDAK